MGLLMGLQYCVSRRKLQRARKAAKGKLAERSECTEHLLVKFAVLYGHGLWCTQAITVVTSVITITI